MSVAQQRNEGQVAVGRKQHEQMKMLDTLSFWLAKINIDFDAAPLHQILS